MAPLVDQPNDRHLRERAAENRTSRYDVEPLIVQRWSPRAMTGAALAESEFRPLFEAARWAPSAYNNQHWRFLYATPADDAWDTFAGLLNEENRVWATDAGLLVVIVSKTTLDHVDEPANTHSFDTGAAWENLALEGTRRGLVVHGIQGFDYDRAETELNVPEDFDVEAMCAVGKPAPKESLPEDFQGREVPSDRKPLEDIVHEGPLEADGTGGSEESGTDR